MKTKKRTIINSTSQSPIPKIREKDKNIMIAYVVSDSNGDIKPIHVGYAASDECNCILALYVFRGGKTQAQAFNTFVGSGNNKKLTDSAISKGVPVYTGIISDKSFVKGNNLGKYGLSGAHIITWLG